MPVRRRPTTKSVEFASAGIHGPGRRTRSAVTRAASRSRKASDIGSLTSGRCPCGPGVISRQRKRNARHALVRRYRLVLPVTVCAVREYFRRTGAQVSKFSPATTTSSIRLTRNRRAGLSCSESNCARCSQSAKKPIVFRALLSLASTAAVCTAEAPECTKMEEKWARVDRLCSGRTRSEDATNRATPSLFMGWSATRTTIQGRHLPFAVAPYGKA